MNRFSNAVRRAIYVIECPMHTIASGAHMARTTVSDIMHGRHKTRIQTALALTDTLCSEIDKQIDLERAKIEKLKALKTELTEAFESEYKVGVVHGS